MIRQCNERDIPAIHAIVNDAARAYYNVIPADCWHEPYMSEDELRIEIAASAPMSTSETQRSRTASSFPRRAIKAVVSPAPRNLRIRGKWISQIPLITMLKTANPASFFSAPENRARLFASAPIRPLKCALSANNRIFRLPTPMWGGKPDTSRRCKPPELK